MDMAIPCYGGPCDGEFHDFNQTPEGYKKFTVRGKLVWLWKPICVEYLDFNILEQASLLDPQEYNFREDK